MARITVEDCLDHVDNRFELVIVGSKRARQIAAAGKPVLVNALIGQTEFRKGSISM